jgi:hypothetical protein
MEDLQPPASPQESLPSSPAIAVTQYKDRRTWLVLFGIVALLIAAFFGFLVAVMMAMPRITGNRPLPPGLPHVFWVSISVGYLLLGLCFVTGGIGSVLAKNWARLLMLVLSWCWLLCGIFAVIGQLIFMVAGRNFGTAPIQNEQLSPHFFHLVQIFTSIVTLIVFVLAPLTFIIFYTRKSVKATCQRTLSVAERERTAPTAIWVLVALLGLHALALFWTATLFPAIAFFGVFLTGWGARVVLIALGVVWAWLAWSCYRRELRAWWIAMGLSVFFGLSNLITNLRHTVDDIYRVMNIPTPSAPLVALYSSMTFRVGFGILFLLAYLGFLLYTKRYFPEPAEGNQTPALS